MLLVISLSSPGWASLSCRRHQARTSVRSQSGVFFSGNPSTVRRASGVVSGVRALLVLFRSETLVYSFLRQSA